MKKVLLLFGAGGALGKGVANIMINKNYDEKYFFDRSEIKYDEKNVTVINTGDLTEEGEVKKAFEKINVIEDAQYFLFSTIGGFEGGNPVSETSYEEWNKMNDINLKTSFLIAKHFFKLCENTKGGSIIFTSAMTSSKPAKNKAAYGASKSGLNHLVKTLSLEGKNNDISVNAIAPLVLDTPENREWVEDTSVMVNSSDIGELIDSIFNNRRILSGNIFDLPGTLE